MKNLNDAKVLIRLFNTSAIASFASLMATFVIANNLGPEDFGYYISIILLGYFASVLHNFALEKTIFRELNITKSRSLVISKLLSARIILFLGMALLFILYFAIAGDIPASFFVMVILITNFNFSSGFEIIGRNGIYAVIHLLERLLYFIFILLCVKIYVLNIFNVFIILFCVTSVSLVCQFYIFSRYCSINLNFSIGEILRSLKEHVFLVMFTLLNLAYGNLSRQLIGFQYGHEQLGHFSSVWQLSVFGTLVAQAASRIFRIQVADALEKKSRSDLVKVFLKFALLVQLPITLGALFITVFGWKILAVFLSDAYENARIYVPVVSMYILGIPLLVLTEIMWISLKSDRLYLALNLISSVGFVVLFFLASHYFDLLTLSWFIPAWQIAQILFFLVLGLQRLPKDVL
jgi:O-antigen/teichoic acid export membrane protein